MESAYKSLTGKNPTHPIACILGEFIGYWGEFFIAGVPISYAYHWIAYNFNLPEATYIECVCLYFLWRAIWYPIKFLSAKK